MKARGRSDPALFALFYPVESYHQDFLTRNPRYAQPKRGCTKLA
jgi:peptide methionine sulfoxide reductase MsrA